MTADRRQRRAGSTVIQQVSSLKEQLQNLRSSILALPVSSEFELSLSAIADLSIALDGDFDCFQRRGRKRASEESTRSQVDTLRRQVRYQTKKADAKEALANDLQYAKVSGRIKNLWFVRIILARPDLPRPESLPGLTTHKMRLTVNRSYHDIS